MKLTELKQRIVLNEIPDRWYSINDGLKTNACIIYHNYKIWEYFYLDEKGQRHDSKPFINAEDAYDHLWIKLEDQLSVFRPHKKG